jgi:hypothetical protein
MRSLPLAVGAVLLALSPLPATRAEQPVLRRDPEAALLYRLEQKIGKPLSFEQRKQVDAAVKEVIEGLATCQNDFGKELAAITGLAAAEIQGMLPVIGKPFVTADRSIVPRIEQKLGRPLSPAELQRLREADAKKKEAMGPVRDNYVRRLADIAGIPVADADGMVPLIGAERKSR